MIWSGKDAFLLLGFIMALRTFNLGHSEPIVYPVDTPGLAALGETSLVSPREGNLHGYSAISDANYALEVADVADVRVLVRSNIWPADFMNTYLGASNLSPILAKYLGLSEANPQKCADAVKSDHPFDGWDNIIEPYVSDEEIVELPQPPDHEGDQMVENVTRRAAAHTAIAYALEKAFDVKYAIGQLRPVEYYDHTFDRYETPNHPESPAGHGAFCGASQAQFELLYVPSAGQIADMTYATKQLAMFRSFAGLHIPFSNLLGWTIGYEA